MTSRLAFRILLALVAFAVLARIPVGFDVGFKFDAALAVIWAFGLLSLVLLTGYVGQISLCQATFAGVGAYGAGMMVSSLHADYAVVPSVTFPYTVTGKSANFTVTVTNRGNARSMVMMESATRPMPPSMVMPTPTTVSISRWMPSRTITRCSTTGMTIALKASAIVAVT